MCLATVSMFGAAFQAKTPQTLFRSTVQAVKIGRAHISGLQQTDEGLFGYFHADACLFCIVHNRDTINSR